VRSGLVAFPAGHVAEPFTDAEDVAAVAAAALAGPGHANRVYEVTGPRALTFSEAVAEIADATGRRLRYQPISPEEYATTLIRDASMPVEDARFLADLFTAIFDGRNSRPTDGVQQALGRPPKDFSDYGRDAARTGIGGTLSTVES